MLKTLFSIIAIAAILAAGVIYSGVYDVSASSSRAGFTEWIFSQTVHASVERRARAVRPPDLKDDALQLAGASDFDFMCASCHGAPGKRLGAMGEGLNPAPPDLADSAAYMTPAELFWVTKHGIKMSGMPAWGATHADDDLWPMVAFMTVLPDLDSELYRAMLARGKGKGHHAANDHVRGADKRHDARSNTEAHASEPESSAHNHGSRAH